MLWPHDWFSQPYGILFYWFSVIKTRYFDRRRSLQNYKNGFNHDNACAYQFIVFFYFFFMSYRQRECLGNGMVPKRNGIVISENVNAIFQDLRSLRCIDTMMWHWDIDNIHIKYKYNSLWPWYIILFKV